MGAALGTPAVTHPPPAEILEAEKADKVERSGEALPAASETHSLNGFAQCAHVPPTETHTSLSLFSARSSDAGPGESLGSAMVSGTIPHWLRLAPTGE